MKVPQFSVFRLFSFCVVLFSLAALHGCLRRLHEDGGLLSQVLTTGWLGGHDGLGTVHPGRGLAAQISTRLLPAPQLSVMLLLDVLFR